MREFKSLILVHPGFEDVNIVFEEKAFSPFNKADVLEKKPLAWNLQRVLDISKKYECALVADRVLTDISWKEGTCECSSSEPFPWM